MRKLFQHIFFLCVCLLACSVSAQAQLLNESFEGASFPPTGWIKQLGANGLGTTFSWNSTTGLTGEGKIAATFVESSGSGTLEKWLVTPQLQPNATNNTLNFKARRQGPNVLFGKLIIRVSTTSQTSHASFTQVAEFNEVFNPSPTGITTTLSSFSVNLSAYNNQNIYVAFVWQNTSGGNGVYLDDVKDIPFVPTTAPIMGVKGNGNVINNGATSTDINNHTNFGVTVINTTDVERTFTIENTGTASLNLTGSPIVTLSGAGASAYAVTQQPTSPVATAGSTTFKIKLLANSTQGTKNATVSIANNTTSTNPFTFAIAGVIGGPNLLLKSNNNNINNGATTTTTTNNTNFGTLALNGSAVENTYTIESSGDLDLNLTGNPLVAISGTDASLFTVTQIPASTTLAPAVTTTFKISFNPTSLGAKSATVSIASNSGVNNPYTFAIGATVSAPQIAITGNSNAIANGSTSIATSSNTDFGDTKLTLFTEKTFTIQNTGGQPLNLTGSPLVAFSGANASDFSISTPPNNPITAGGNTTFTIKFSPTSPTGAKTATVTIASNSNTNSTYTFAIGGNATPAPIATIGVLGNGNPITNGSTTTSATNNTHFGTVQATFTGEKTFTINNTGDGSLALNGSPIVAISGTNASEFSLSQNPASSVASAQSTTFKILFSPTSAGTKTATITIASNSTTNAPYTFAIAGEATAPPIPLIGLLGNGNTISSGSTTISTNNHTDFSGVVINQSFERTFTIQNTGTGNLSLSGSPLVIISGTDGGLFAVSQAPSSVVAAGQSTNFKITFTPTTVGAKTATVTLTSNTNNTPNATFTFAIGGTGNPLPAPAIIVKGNNTAISNGSTTASTSNHTDFGETATTDVERTFTIENTGTATLTLSGSPLVSISGANASEFSVTQSPSTSVLAGQSTTFKINFNPTTPSVKNATVSFGTNVAGIANFTFAIKGTGAPALSVAPRLSVGKLAMYPNPARHTLSIHLEGNTQTALQMEITDLQGKPMHKQAIELAYGRAQMRLPKLKAGTYLVRVQVGKEWVIEKIVIE